MANQKQDEWMPDNDPENGSTGAPGSEIIVEPEEVPEGWMTVRHILRLQAIVRRGLTRRC